jgi:hypothetical protein
MRDFSHQAAPDLNNQGTLDIGRMSSGRVVTRRRLVTVTDHVDPARAETSGVRVCDICGRPVAARDKDEYTVARARLVIDKGLCVCPTKAQAPERGPSLI